MSSGSSALEEALKWALEQVRFFGSAHHKPDDPFWNAYRNAQAALEGRDPDRDEPYEKAKDKARELLANMKEMRGDG